MYRTFAHTADVGLRIETADRNGLFAEAGRAFFSLIVANLGDVQSRSSHDFEIAGDDLEFLLVDWLNELLFAYESKRLLLCEFDVAIGPDGLKATAAGETVDPQRHRLDHEVKAITYHGLKVEQTPQGWAAEVIVDI
jgi:SHS2 domain-containing protein